MENNLLDLGYEEIKTEIRNNISNMVLSFIDVGYWLKQIRDKELFKEDGYKNVYDMAQAEFNMSRTVVSRFMSINDKYSVGGNSRELLEQFQGFGKSALTEMLSLPVEDYELLTPDTKVEDIRELKEAEREVQEEQDSQIEGQMNILNDIPDIVPEADKPAKKEADISEAIRELFRPREMKEYLDKLVNMDPESNAMDWWVADFNASGNRTFKHIPFFLFFYGKEEGLKIKNIFKNTIEKKTYQDFYFMVRAAYPQETVRGTDVWMQAYGEEWKKQQEKEAADQENAAAREEKPKKKKSSKKVDSIQSPAVLEDEKKAPETAENRENREETLSNEVGKASAEPQKTEEEKPERVDFIQSAANPENQEKSLCDIAQTGCNIWLPVAPGGYLYLVTYMAVDIDTVEYVVESIRVFIYEFLETLIKLRYFKPNKKENEVSLYYMKPDQMQKELKGKNIYMDKEEAERVCALKNKNVQLVTEDDEDNFFSWSRRF